MGDITEIGPFRIAVPSRSGRSGRPTGTLPLADELPGVGWSRGVSAGLRSADLLERYEEDDQEQEHSEDQPGPWAPPPDRWWPTRSGVA